MENVSVFKLLAAKTNHEDLDKWLPLWMHLKDTAEIMDILARRWLPDSERRILCQYYSLSESELYKLCKFVAYTHDIGKATKGFQSKILVMLPDIREKIQNNGISVPEKSEENMSHALASEIILLSYGCDRKIASVIGAHHGKPQEKSATKVNISYSGLYGEQESEWSVIWNDIINHAFIESGYMSIDELPDIDIKQQVILSGLLIMADWIASNTTYFPLISVDDKGSLTLYPNRVETAWERLSLTENWESRCFEMDDEEFEKRFGFMPNSIQGAFVNILENSDKPGVIILEAQMGIGKTEAALAGAEILAQRYGCGGLFFGMPTQATANGVFGRIMDWGKYQSENSNLSVKLAHGAAEINEEYTSLFKGRAHVDDSEDPDDKNGLMIHSWFQGKKQAMLSNFVVGTVDQLLMMALKRKHVMLRHLGMAGKVVVVDEAHSYDAYMSRYLESALQWLGAYNVPVIILSATLPGDRREKLVAAYLNKRLKDDKIKKQRGYPLITWTDGERVYCKVVESDSEKRNIDISVIDDNKIIGIISDAVASGGCVSVILNAVKRAQKVTEKVRQTVSDANIILFHSQFIMTDRAYTEKKITEMLGKHSNKDQRSHTVVIGTQVLEQSLDIDADVMITDLCPMDLLLQRIGRLHRHRAHDVIRPEALKKARCFVVTPNGEEFEEGSKAIYGEYLMMRTKALLPKYIIIPDSIPKLIQNVYDDEINVDVDEKKYAEAREEFLLKTGKKKSKADVYCMDRPSSSKRLNMFHDWLSQVDTSISDATAQAAVRDGNISIEAIVLVKSDGEIHFLPWQNGGIIIDNSIIPSEEEIRQISRQKIKLPSVFCTEYSCGNTIKELEIITLKNFAEWQYAPMLRGELILLLDKNLRGELNGYDLNYSREKGLVYDKKGW